MWKCEFPHAKRVWNRILHTEWYKEYIVHFVGEMWITQGKSPRFSTRCTRYCAQLPETEMQLWSELRRRSYRFLNRLTDYQYKLQFGGYILFYQDSTQLTPYGATIHHHFLTNFHHANHTLLSPHSLFPLMFEIKFPPRIRHRLRNLWLSRLLTSLENRITGVVVGPNNFIFLGSFLEIFNRFFIYK